MRKRIAVCCFALVVVFVGLFGNASAITSGEKDSIMDYCQTIKDNLSKVQKIDARTRVYLGGYFETVLSKFIMPLNVRIVENNLSDPLMIENQTKMAEAKSVFSNDYVTYQKNLEELVGIDCKAEPEKFYDKLVSVRKKRKIVEQDVMKMRSLVSEHVKLVNGLKGKI